MILVEESGLVYFVSLIFLPLLIHCILSKCQSVRIGTFKKKKLALHWNISKEKTGGSLTSILALIDCSSVIVSVQVTQNYLFLNVC